jgi:hypothetical protein
MLVSKFPSRNPTSKTLENIGIDQSCLSANLMQKKSQENSFKFNSALLDT